MSYTALYRKFRPHTFEGIIGQEHIVRTLANQIKQGRISHAYLFCGTRGTGKTSIAKIFARAVNCENPQDGQPCGECGFCRMSAEQAAMVIYEIDAASNNGVDNVRDIIETVKYPPAMGRYKVYIIDEVHMLSTGAFNALLKTLEEPPEHVIFILATTEPHKIPATIHSRCQRFDFRRISAKDIAQLLRSYVDKEQVQVDDDALAYIGRVSDGAMRDALSILDQCLSFYYGEHITLEKTLAILGAVSNDVLFRMTDALRAFDAAGCMAIIDEIVMQGKDTGHFVAELLAHIRNLLVAASVKENSTALDFSMENAAAIREQSKTISKDMLLQYIQSFSELQSRMKYAANERILLEVTCLRLCNSAALEEENDNAALVTRLRKLEAGLQSLAKAPGPAAIPADGELAAAVIPQTAPKPKLQKAIPDEINKAIGTWPALIEAVKAQKEPFLASLLSQCAPCYLDNHILTIACKDKITLDLLQKSENTLKQCLATLHEREFDIRLQEQEEHNRRHEDMYGMPDEVFKAFESKLNW